MNFTFRSFTADKILENSSEQGRDPTTHMSLTLELNQTFATLEGYDRLSRPTPIATTLPLKRRTPMHFLDTLILRPFQLEQKYQTNCGYKHNGTTHVVKSFIYGLDVSYASTYIFRSNGYLNYN